MGNLSQKLFFSITNFLRQGLFRYLCHLRKLVSAKSYFLTQLRNFDQKISNYGMGTKEFCQNLHHSRKFIPVKFDFCPLRSQKFILAKVSTRESFYLQVFHRKLKRRLATMNITNVSHLFSYPCEGWFIINLIRDYHQLHAT